VWQTCDWILCCRWEYWIIVLVGKLQYVGWLIQRNRTRLSILKVAHLQNAVIISVIIASNRILTLSLGWTVSFETVYMVSVTSNRKISSTREYDFVLIRCYWLSWITFREDEGLIICRNFGNNLSVDSAQLPTRLESSSTPLRERRTSQITITYTSCPINQRGECIRWINWMYFY